MEIGKIIAVSIILIISFLFLIGLLAGRNFPGHLFESDQRRAGRMGEKKAADIIRSVLWEEDTLLTNVKITYDGREAELDAVVVNRFGVFIFEVKNYSGQLYGDEDDFEWYQQKITDAGNVYDKTVKNPIKQVKRQVYLLAQYLNDYGKRIWVDGYAILLQGNSPVKSDMVISSIGQLDRVIHTQTKNRLRPKDVKQIINLLKERNKIL